MALAHRPQADAVPCVGTESGVHHHDHHALLVGFVVGLGGDDFLPELQQVLGRVGGDGAGVLANVVTVMRLVLPGRNLGAFMFQSDRRDVSSGIIRHSSRQRRLSRTINDTI